MENKKLLVDLAQNSSSLHITPQIYLRILQKAIDQTSQDIKDMESALPISDYPKVQTITHKLIGDYENLRITMLSSLARQMNVMVKAQQDTEKIVLLLNDFVTYFEQLRQFVAKSKTT
ncbi:MAG: hypothetical protein A2787_02695 [Omnitrophica WOR_2 bacterium RIFCSPHIGHO2_01_FULL_48_9]|nr:MAG: hypothetical protein A3D10_01505 [Omnitrophica WOR_2 bacterium RIFCSPHIGHO2_02_FULL_48_11]OGX31004.1 MAG: hypothetical protein A2787_02695 [Omnitrophica WOR_2 bacterium RIFCSPHIGHO2_01_FULL_48_9]